MSDPYSIQSVGRLGGSLGGRARVASPVHRVRPALITRAESCPCIARADGLSYASTGGAAFDGTTIYVPNSGHHDILTIPFVGAGGTSTLYAGDGTDRYASPTVDAATGTLYWVRRNESTDDSYSVESYDLSQGPLGTAVEVYNTGVGPEISPIRFHPATGLLYGLTDRDGGGTSHLISIDPATGIPTTLYAMGVGATDEAGFQTFAPMTTTPTSVWGFYALDSSQVGIFRWDIAGASISLLNPFAVTADSAEAPMGMVGLSSGSVLTSWFHNIGLASPTAFASQRVLVSPSFALSALCAPGSNFSGPFDSLDATAPGWAFAIFSDGTNIDRYPC